MNPSREANDEKQPHRARGETKNTVTIIGLLLMGVCFLVMARYVDSNVQNSSKKVSEAVDAARAAIGDKVKAETEAMVAKEETSRAEADSVEEIGQLVNAYEAVNESKPPNRESRNGWVYLGICKGGRLWFKTFFDDLPECAEGALQAPAMITSSRGVSLRLSPPTQGPIGREVNRIKTRGTVRLSRMVAIAPTNPRALKIYWGEIEIP